jgi:3',5'-cyclic AMP phosphodiesterase CpdA
MHRRHFLSTLGGAAMAAATAHRTSAAGPAEPFCFCVAADPHCNDVPAKGMEELGTGADRLMRVLDSIGALPAADRPDFLLIAGDLHLKGFLPLMPRFPLPVHVTAGNHESSVEDRKALRAAFPQDFVRNGKPADYYSFVHKGVRFVSPCTAGLGGEHIGTFASENIQPRGQCEWLEGELAAPEARKVLFTHIPAEREGADREMHLGRNDSRWFIDLVRRTRPEAAFFGHLHRPTETYRMGTTDVWQVRSCCWNFSAAPIGFLHVRVGPAGLTVQEIITGEARSLGREAGG